MSEVVAIIGNGKLAQTVGELLSEYVTVARLNGFDNGIPESVRLVLALSDEWRPREYEQIESEMRRIGLPWLRGCLIHDEGVVGPLVQPGKPGCSQCAELRSNTAGRDREQNLEIQMSLLLHGTVPPMSSVSWFGIEQTSCLIAAEVWRMLHGKPVQTVHAVYFVNLRSLESALHPFVPDSACPYCGNRPLDSEENAKIVLQPSPKLDAEAYRIRSLDGKVDKLKKEYVNERTGLFNRISIDLQSPYANAFVNLPAPGGDEPTAGRSHSYAHSVLTAMLEGLERYCGIYPRGKITTVHDSYRRLSDRALHPGETGLYSAEQYAHEDFPLRPFDPDRPLNWVWGYSMMQERPILVPEQLAYYSSGTGDAFVIEGSNGCALGSSLEEAILYGVMEVVERDAFLMAWYARHAIPKLDPYSSGDAELQLMIERLQAVSGYDVHLFNATTENRIPSIWAIAKNRTTKGAHLFCAGGAHLDPVRAAKSAILETAGNIVYASEELARNEETHRAMLTDPDLVTRMEDHVLLYGNPEAEERLSFLLDRNDPPRSFTEEFGSKVFNADLTDDLKDVLNRFRTLQLDVIVIDQTAPEIRGNGLYCVKILIPGMLPMSFGHRMVRLSGLKRAPTELNPFPHPFP
ncbi:TOMM precursor leader peptide-binding protein [Cohnella terricola]|uniref:TOMM leader peptide-binding protein n=1 Tax=Cohnella terricola TaxID=1289167 RepID=A0A559JQ49_9BACL|nr:TOMM precursor leader peptide-binding protein [Cohnella terricola]TVY02002.1 TOMM precursor leader peptide-binding protein [Cohnella terricola]